MFGVREQRCSDIILLERNLKWGIACKLIPVKMNRSVICGDGTMCIVSCWKIGKLHNLQQSWTTSMKTGCSLMDHAWSWLAVIGLWGQPSWYGVWSVKFLDKLWAQWWESSRRLLPQSLLLSSLTSVSRWRGFSAFYVNDDERWFCKSLGLANICWVPMLISYYGTKMYCRHVELWYAVWAMVDHPPNTLG